MQGVFLLLAVFSCCSTMIVLQLEEGWGQTRSLVIRQNGFHVRAGNHFLGVAVTFFSKWYEIKVLLKLTWLSALCKSYVFPVLKEHSFMLSHEFLWRSTLHYPSPHKNTHTHTHILPKVICIWVTVYLISENQSKIAFFFFLPHPQHRRSYFKSGNRCTKRMQRALCLLQHHCCVIHMLDQISRQAGKGLVWKVKKQPPFALIAMVPLSKVRWLFYSSILTFHFSFPNAVVVSYRMEQSIYINLRLCIF